MFTTPAFAQFKEAVSEKGPKLGQELPPKRIKLGVVVKAKSGPCKGIIGTVPVPIDWPEQKVEVIEEDISPTIKNVRYRMLGGSVKQMIVEIPSLGSGQEAHALVTFEVKRRQLLPPDKPEIYSIPKKLDRGMLIYTAPSPYIESRHGKIVSLAREIAADKETAWEQVEAIYDWVRDNVEYKNGDLKGALRALNDKNGDCEELSSLFIALCRANKIPARTVWVPGHCYPEFYLVDDEGNGFWFPCQAAGTRDFGGIPEQRPILQKGDNFKDPDRPRERHRYVSEFVKGSTGGAKPEVNFINEVIGN